MGQNQLRASIQKRIEQRMKETLKIQMRLQNAKQAEFCQNTEPQTPDETDYLYRGSQSHRISRIEPQNEVIFKNAFKEVKTG